MPLAPLQNLPADRTPIPTRIFLYILLLVIPAAIYARAASYPYIRCDDQELVQENPNLHPPTLDHLKQFWMHSYAGLYTPLSYTALSAVASIAADQTGNLDPRYFHALNILLHLLCTALVFSILLKLIKNPWPAFAGALLFALHPIQVEPVAWISGMNNLLAAAFSLAAIRLYLSHALASRAAVRWTFFAAATAAFILALLAKPTAVVVPLILLIIDLLILARPLRRFAAPLSFWFILALAEAIITRAVQPVFAFSPSPFWQRPIIALDAIACQAAKILLPANFSIDYARTPRALWNSGDFFVSCSAVLVAAVVVWIFRRKTKWIAAALLIFLAGLLPTLGLIPFDFQEYSTVADRYAYLAMLGPALIAAWLLSSLANHPTKNITKTIAICWLTLLAILSAVQISYWQNTQTLTAHALKLHATGSLAASIRAADLTHLNRPAEAIPFYRDALLRNPNEASLHYNLANALLATQHYTEARDEYLQAIPRLGHGPNLPAALNNLGITYWKTGHPTQAADQFRAALQIDPTYTLAQQNLSQL